MFFFLRSSQASQGLLLDPGTLVSLIVFVRTLVLRVMVGLLIFRKAEADRRNVYRGCQAVSFGEIAVGRKRRQRVMQAVNDLKAEISE